jgi:hypothetical protein
MEKYYMVLTITGCFVMCLGLVITWLILFSLFTEKSPRALGLKLAVIVLMLWPVIAKISLDFYATISRQIFMMKGYNGEIQLSFSPMKIKLNKKGYCGQFKDDKGNALKMTTIAEDGNGYCGEYWGREGNKVVFLPYRLLDNDTAIYWASPDLLIVGPKPDFLSLKTNKNHSNNSASEKPKEIYVKEGQSAAVVITKSFDLTLDNQSKKTIEDGTVLSGFTLNPLHANGKPSPTQIKLMIDTASCIASSTTPIRPDYTTATAITKIASLSCTHDESNAIPIEAIASVSGQVLYTKNH